MVQFFKKDVEYIDEIDNQYAIYFLLKERNIYIGQTNNLKSRIINHSKDESKDFDFVIAFISEKNIFSRTFIDYLEFYYMNKFYDCGQFNVINTVNRNEPSISKTEKIKIDDSIETINNFLLSINIDLFNSLNNRNYFFVDNKKNNIVKKSKFINVKEIDFKNKKNRNIDIYRTEKTFKNIKKEGWVKKSISENISKITLDNVKRFIELRCIYGYNQSEAEEKVFGIDTHGNIAKGLRETIGIEFKVIKKLIKSKQDFEWLINNIEYDIEYAISRIKKEIL